MYYSAAYKYSIFDQVDEPIAIVTAGFLSFDTYEKLAFTSRTNGLPNCQVLYIKRGTGVFDIDGNEMKISGGNVLIFRENEPQVYRYISEIAETHWVHFAGTEASKLLDKYGLTGKIIPVNNGNTIEKLFRGITDEVSAKKPFFEDAAITKLEMLLIEIHRNENTVTQKWSIQAINNICDEMRVKYLDNTTNSEYAQKCKMSLPYFMRTFKKVTGTSPQEYRTEQRIEAAKNMLLNTDYKISYIAFNSGFDDPLYFSRCFKKKTGTSPANYRKNSRIQ